MSSVLMSCGGSSGSNSNLGSLALDVEDAYYPSSISRDDTYSEKLYQLAKSASKSEADLLSVVKFKVTVSSDNLDAPISQEAEAGSSQIQILELDPGEIDILIEAYNLADEVIRRREITSVAIKAGVVTPIKTRLHTVPVILNIKENAVVLSTNFKVIGFGEPGSVLSVNTQANSENLSLSQSVDDKVITLTPSLSTGLFEFLPDSLPKGKQTIELSDTTTGETFTRNITVVTVDERPGTKISAQKSGDLDVRIGASIGSQMGTHFPTIQSNLSDDEDNQ